MPAGGLLAASILAPAAGGLVGYLAGSGDRDKAMAAKQAALQQMLGIDAPTAQQLMVNLSKENVAGQLSPTLQGTVTESPSAMQGILVNPQLRAAQMNALAQLQQLGATGLTAADRAALEQIRQQTSGQAAALSKTALSNAAQRGMAGSGASLAAQLMAAQGAANTGAQQGLNVASQAQQKALQAMSNAGALGSQIEGQQFGEEAQKAAAADAIARFNAANRQNVMGQNVGAQNQAQLYNLQNAQDIANRNVAIANQQALQHTQAQQQAYEDALRRAQGIAGQEQNVAQQYGQQAQQTANMFSGIGQGIGSAAGSGFGAMGGFSKNPMGNAPTIAGEESVDLNTMASSPTSTKGAVQGPALPGGQLTTSEAPDWYDYMNAGKLGTTGPTGYTPPAY